MEYPELIEFREARPILKLFPDESTFPYTTPKAKGVAAEPPAAAHEAVVPLDVRTYPLVPIANLVELFDPFPIIKSPVVVIGDKALKAVDAVVCPVPPFAMLKALVKLNDVTAKVPVDGVYLYFVELVYSVVIVPLVEDENNG